MVPDNQVEALRRFKRDQYILLLASNDLPEEVKEVVEQAKEYMASRLSDLEIDVEPHRLPSETGDTTEFL